MRVLVACEFTGTVRDAFLARGHDAWSCDLLPSESRQDRHFHCDVRDVIGRDWDMLIAHPVCTRLANSGVRWLTKPPRGKTLKEMWAALDEGVNFYRLFQQAPIQFKAIENPIMHRHARERLGIIARQVVQPWWFGDPQFKAIGWELTGLPPLVATTKLSPPKRGTPEHKAWSKVHRASPGPNRWRERSRFFPGIAAAMADQWGAYVASRMMEAA